MPSKIIYNECHIKMKYYTYNDLKPLINPNCSLEQYVELNTFETFLAVECCTEQQR